MIMVNKGDGTYVEVIAIYAKNQNQYREISKGYTQDGELIFSPTYMINESYGYMSFQILADGDNVEDYTIWGNTVQDGVPSPENPIEPEFVGERTKNLFDIETVVEGYIRPDGTIVTPGSAQGWFISDYIEINPSTVYTINPNSSTGVLAYHAFYDVNKSFISSVESGLRTATSPINAKYLRISYRSGSYGVMVNEGSIALPYEPYGYKIPISSGGVNLAPPLSEWVEGFIDVSGNLIVNQPNGVRSSDYIHVTPNVTYWFGDSNPGGFPDGGGVGRWSGIAWYDGNKSFISRYTRGVVDAYGTNAPNNAKFARLTLRKYGDTHNLMFNAGSTALPYEPYVTPTVKNIYLGQVQTIRRIKKLVCDGTEGWNSSSWGNGAKYLFPKPSMIGRTQMFCTHFPWVRYADGAQPPCCHSDGSIRLWKEVGISTPDFKAWLAEQYAAGTPVKVWYVLAEPEVGIFNEPLARIGDYADSVDFSQAGVEIPTLKKPNTTVIDIETEVKPSVINLTYWGEWQDKTAYLSSDNKLYITTDNQIYYTKR